MVDMARPRLPAGRGKPRIYAGAVAAAGVAIALGVGTPEGNLAAFGLCVTGLGMIWRGYAQEKRDSKAAAERPVQPA